MQELSLLIHHVFVPHRMPSGPALGIVEPLVMMQHVIDPPSNLWLRLIFFEAVIPCVDCASSL